MRFSSAELLDAKLRKEYEQLYGEIEKAKEALLKALREQSHSKKSIEDEITTAFTADNFYTALHRITKELENQTDAPFAEIEYDRIFDEKVLAILGTQDARSALDDYVRRYNELLAASLFFKKGVFDYYNAGQIAKSLAKNGFFDAKHSVYLNALTADKPHEIHSQKELEAVIAKEKQAILKDPKLREQFDKLGVVLEKNETLRDFQKYMMDQPELLSQLSSVTKFKQDIWKSYLRAKYDLYLDLISKHDKAQKRQRCWATIQMSVDESRILLPLRRPAGSVAKDGFMSSSQTQMPELIAAAKEMCDALRVIYRLSAQGALDDLQQELKGAGVTDGFSKRLQEAIAKAEVNEGGL